jgi:hypothetical protein
VLSRGFVYYEQHVPDIITPRKKGNNKKEKRRKKIRMISNNNLECVAKKPG